MKRSRARVLVVGIGGIGCPAVLALAGSGVETLGLCDDDVVERSNLHRQILFRDADVGFSKLDAAARGLSALGSSSSLRFHRNRLLPENALSVVRDYDVVLEASDNFATKFLLADACVLAGVPVVHASAIRWIGTVLATGARGRPCYRCVFEDMPPGGVAACADAGVMGPVAGVIAGVQVDLALALLDGHEAAGTLATFDGRTDALRSRQIAARAACTLCGSSARIQRIESNTYISPAADAAG